MNLKNDKNGVCPLQVYIYSWVMFCGCFGECFLVWSSEPTTLAPSPCCLFVFVYFGWHLSHSDLNLGHAHTPKSHATLHIRVLQTSAFFFIHKLSWMPGCRSPSWKSCSKTSLLALNLKSWRDLWGALLSSKMSWESGFVKSWLG